MNSWVSLQRGAPAQTRKVIEPPSKARIFLKTMASKIGVDSPFLMAARLKGILFVLKFVPRTLVNQWRVTDTHKPNRKTFELWVTLS